MKKVLVILLFAQLFISCGPKNFLTSKGLNFTMDDWRKFYEQPYVVNTVQGADMYLPVALFGESEIKMVYFENMQSDQVEYTGDKSQIVVHFIKSTHTVEKPVYDLYKNHAVVKITNGGKRAKYLKLKDIRLPNS